VACRSLLVGTFAECIALGYALGQSLAMALISTNLVVDECLVMIENISAAISRKASADGSALKATEQIGFTIVSFKRFR